MSINYNYQLENGQLNPLQQKEVEVIQLLCEGENIGSIAERVFKSKDTINQHIRSAKNKLNAKSRDELIAKAVTKGIVNVQP